MEGNKLQVQGKTITIEKLICNFFEKAFVKKYLENQNMKPKVMILM